MHWICSEYVKFRHDAGFFFPRNQSKSINCILFNLLCWCHFLFVIVVFICHARSHTCIYAQNFPGRQSIFRRICMHDLNIWWGLKKTFYTIFISMNGRCANWDILLCGFFACKPYYYWSSKLLQVFKCHNQIFYYFLCELNC